MKILSWEGIRIVLQEQDKVDQRDNMFRLEAIAKAQHLDTLRQVREILAGIENPYTGGESTKMGAGFYEAIQTMKERLEEETFICPWCEKEKPISIRCGKGYCLGCSGQDF